jgi:hypothetical protein
MLGPPAALRGPDDQESETTATIELQSRPIISVNDRAVAAAAVCRQEPLNRGLQSAVNWLKIDL